MAADELSRRGHRRAGRRAVPCRSSSLSCFMSSRPLNPRVGCRICRRRLKSQMDTFTHPRLQESLRHVAEVHSIPPCSSVPNQHGCPIS